MRKNKTRIIENRVKRWAEEVSKNTTPLSPEYASLIARRIVKGNRLHNGERKRLAYEIRLHLTDPEPHSAADALRAAYINWSLSRKFGKLLKKQD